MENKEVAKTEQPKTMAQILNGESAKAQFAAALPAAITPDRFVRFALTAINKSPKLKDCTQSSVFDCLLTCAQLGIEPDGRRAHLIPYGTSCTLVVDYKGIVELVMRSGKVKKIHSDKVCRNDVFDYQMGDVVAHKIDFSAPRGDAIAYYSTIVFDDGVAKTEVMSKDEIESIRKRSKAANSGPWVSDFDEMAKKTVFKRAAKWVPWSAEIMQHMEAADVAEFGLDPEKEIKARDKSDLPITPEDAKAWSNAKRAYTLDGHLDTVLCFRPMSEEHQTLLKKECEAENVA
jgi:recombination protein RecT